MRRLAHGAPTSRLGLPPFDGLTVTTSKPRSPTVYGWKGDGPRARIAPDAHGRELHRGVRAGARGRTRRRTHRVRDRAPGVAAAAVPAPGRTRAARRAQPCSAPTRPRRSVRRADGCGGSTRSRCSPTAPRSSATTASTPPTSGCSRSPAPTSSCADRTYAGRRGRGRARGGRVRRPRRGRPRRRRVAGPGDPGRAARRPPAALRVRRSARPARRDGGRPDRPDCAVPGTRARRARSCSFATRGRRGLRSPRGEAGDTEGVSQWRSHSPRRGS